MSEVDNFISTIKEKRSEALEAFQEKVIELKNQDGVDNGAEILKTAASFALDQLAGGILDVVEERYADLVTGSATDSEGEEVSVELSISTGLSTLYFEEVSS